MAQEPALSDYLNLSSKTSTFVSIDVVGSTAIKTGQNEQDIIYTFLSYHKLVSELSYRHHGEVFNITGDGLMCRFQRPDDAARMSWELLTVLQTFNRKQNHLTKPLAIRIGIHTGEVFESSSLSSGQLISKTIDTAAKLQETADTNHARLSEATYTQLSEKSSTYQRVGWNAALGTNVYDFSIDGASHAQSQRRMPAPCRTLVIEPELDELGKLKKALMNPNRDVFSTFNHNQAALVMGSWVPNLVLLSMDLPWSTGWEFLTNLRADAQVSHIPIIVMSNQTTGETIQKAFKMGANGFLRKPLDEQQIMKRTEMVLREFYL